MPLRSIFNSFNRSHYLPPHLRDFFLGAFFVTLAQSFLFISARIFLFEASIQTPQLQLVGLGEIERGLLGVILYFFIERGFMAGSLPLIGKAIQRLGFSFSIIAGITLNIISLVLLTLVPVSLWALLASSAIGAWAIGLYWISYHTVFTAEMVIPKLGRQVSTMEFLGKLGQLMAPLLGAFLSAYFGFASVILVSSLFFVISFTFFLRLPLLKVQQTWNWNTFRKWIMKKGTLFNAVALGAFQWQSIGVVIFWPVFLFISFGRIESVGYIISASTFLSLLTIYFAGWLFDTKTEKRFLEQSAGVVLGLLWIPRLIFTAFPLVLIFNDALERIVGGLFNTYFTASILTQARATHAFHYHLNREAIISFTTTTMCLIFLTMLFLGWSWTTLFASFMLASFVSVLLRPASLSKNEPSTIG